MNVIVDDLRGENIFHTRSGIKGQICSMIIDNESGANIVSSYINDKLELTCIKHTAYK